MGCCVSTRKKSQKKSQKPPNHQQHFSKPELTHVRDDAAADRAPPPSMEEETVKEVLSETPIFKPRAPVIVEEHKPAVEDRIDVEPKANVVVADEVSEISQLSEICTVSESLETTTLGDDEVVSRGNGDDGCEVRRRTSGFPANVVGKRAFNGEIAGEKERRVRSPAKRSRPSPERWKRVLTPGAAAASAARSNVVSAGVRRDVGEGSGRRSRSPATRAEGGRPRPARSRSPAVKTAAGASGSSTTAPLEKSAIEKSEERDSPLTKESLENPLVSLECFIFL